MSCAAGLRADKADSQVSSATAQEMVQLVGPLHTHCAGLPAVSKVPSQSLTFLVVSLISAAYLPQGRSRTPRYLQQSRFSLQASKGFEVHGRHGCLHDGKMSREGKPAQAAGQVHIPLMSH